MRRAYRNVHIALITGLLLLAVAFEAVAGDGLSGEPQAEIAVVAH